MADKTTNYQCPACTGPLHFAGASGMLECDYCGTKYTVEDIEALYREKDERAAKADAGEEKKAGSAAMAAKTDAGEEKRAGSGAMAAKTDAGAEKKAGSGAAAAHAGEAREEEEEAASEDNGYEIASEEWQQAESESLRGYNCSSCGAELVCDDNTAVTQCPYCGNPTVIPSRFAGGLKPDFVIPFEKDKQSAVEALKGFYAGKKLLPKEFKDENQINKVQGLYVPFWLFTSDADVAAEMTGQKTSVHTHGNERVTTVRYYKVHRAGSISFEKIPADGARKMPDEYMDAIEPFDFGKMKPFSTAYMPGYLVDKFDVSAEECSARADARMKTTAVNEMVNDVKGYSSLTLDSDKVNIRRGKIHYAMLPVWVLHTKWHDNDYLFCMNGQTGEMVGSLPVDKKKYTLMYMLFLIGLTVGLSILACIVAIFI